MAKAARPTRWTVCEAPAVATGGGGMVLLPPGTMGVSAGGATQTGGCSSAGGAGCSGAGGAGCSSVGGAGYS